MRKKNKNNKNLNFNDISIIYKTNKQFWGISSHGNKKRIAKKKFESLLKIKKLVSYKDSKIFKRDIKFAILTNKIDINLNGTRQFVQTLSRTSTRYTFIDMFSGAGGLSQGLIEAGLIPLLCIDDNTDSCKTLTKNHSNVTVVNDKVQNFNFSKFRNKVDVLVGGTPCQSFSYAGLRKGLLDPNGIALLEFIKTILISYDTLH